MVCRNRDVKPLLQSVFNASGLAPRIFTCREFLSGRREFLTVCREVGIYFVEPEPELFLLPPPTAPLTSRRTPTLSFSNLKSFDGERRLEPPHRRKRHIHELGLIEPVRIGRQVLLVHEFAIKSRPKLLQ